MSASDLSEVARKNLPRLSHTNRPDFYKTLKKTIVCLTCINTNAPPMVKSMIGPWFLRCPNHDRHPIMTLDSALSSNLESSYSEGKTTSDISLVAGSFTVTRQVKDAHHATPLITGRT